MRRLLLWKGEVSSGKRGLTAHVPTHVSFPHPPHRQLDSSHCVSSSTTLRKDLHGVFEPSSIVVVRFSLDIYPGPPPGSKDYQIRIVTSLKCTD